MFLMCFVVFNQFCSIFLLYIFMSGRYPKIAFRIGSPIMGILSGEQDLFEFTLNPLIFLQFLIEPRMQPACSRLRWRDIFLIIVSPHTGQRQQLSIPFLLYSHSSRQMTAVFQKSAQFTNSSVRDSLWIVKIILI